MTQDVVVVLGDQLYTVVRSWGQVPDHLQIDRVTRLAVDADGNLFALQRSRPSVLTFDKRGSFLNAWDVPQLVDPHGFTVTPGGLVLMTDRDGHQVLGFDRNGSPAMVIGDRERPRHAEPFNHPAGVAVDGDGRIFVSDGYANSAVHRFSPDGEWELSWGRPGRNVGQFTTPHAVAVLKSEVYVADREANRIQVFTQDGDYLRQIEDVYHPMDLAFDGSGKLLVSDQTPRLSLFDTTGDLVGRCKPVPHGAHGIACVADGQIYLTEVVAGNGITALIPR